MNTCTEGALFFYNNDAINEVVIPGKPVGILFLTSLRDIALEEYNGQVIDINNQKYYMRGVIENTLIELCYGGVLHGIIEVKGVIVDDTPDDLAGKFTLIPEESKPWIFPLRLLGKEKIWNIQSIFRKLPKNDISGRSKAKFLFEESVFNKMHEIGADVIISDSYMGIIEYLIDDFGLHGKVLNIHPGPTLKDRPYCFRGPDPIRDALDFASLTGEPVYTGATLHFVNKKIDDGKCIAYICNTFVSPSSSEIELMVDNYVNAKIPIFINGLKHYILHMLPYLK